MRFKLYFLLIIVLSEKKVITEPMNITSTHNTTIFDSKNIDTFNNQTITTNSIQGWRCHCWNSTNELEV